MDDVMFWYIMGICTGVFVSLWSWVLLRIFETYIETQIMKILDKDK